MKARTESHRPLALDLASSKDLTITKEGFLDLFLTFSNYYLTSLDQSSFRQCAAPQPRREGWLGSSPVIDIFKTAFPMARLFRFHQPTPAHDSHKVH
jgi:hypothetical protein